LKENLDRAIFCATKRIMKKEHKLWLQGFEESVAKFPPPKGEATERLLTIVRELQAENAALRTRLLECGAELGPAEKQ
jgi:hypothetical protein